VEVTTIVGVGVPVVCAGCVHPAARTSTTQSTSAEVMSRIFFIVDNYMGVYLIIASLLAWNMTVCILGTRYQSYTGIGVVKKIDLLYNDICRKIVDNRVLNDLLTEMGYQERGDDKKYEKMLQLGKEIADTIKNSFSSRRNLS
jgi:hypothetical protein